MRSNLSFQKVLLLVRDILGKMNDPAKKLKVQHTMELGATTWHKLMVDIPALSRAENLQWRQMKAWALKER